ncbi:MAG: hypothetical protein ACLTNO_06950 [Blautia sp.]
MKKPWYRVGMSPHPIVIVCVGGKIRANAWENRALWNLWPVRNLAGATAYGRNR